MESNYSTSQQNQHQANEILDLLNIHSTTTKPAVAKPEPTTTEVRQLFIGNLPFRVRWQDIKDLFRKAGHVIRADVALNYENRSKGHGTVLFTCIEDAQKAIDMYNGYKWQGRILEVRGDRGFVDNGVAIYRKSSQQTEDEQHQHTSPVNKKVITPPPASPSPPPAAVVVVKEETKQDKIQVEEEEQEEKIEQEEDKDDEDDCKQLFVGNLPFHCQWQDLKDLFRNSGRILRADVVLNFEGRSRGFGTVLFNSHEDAKNAIKQYNGFEFHNRILRVHFDKFAASHQRFREHEANTFGQRQIHDPASIELLRQTYLSPQQQQQQTLYGFNSFMPQVDAYYNMGLQQQAYSSVTQQNASPYMTSLLPFGNNNLDMYHGMMNDNRMMPSLNNFGYQQQQQQHSPSFSTNNTTTTTTTTNTYNNVNNHSMMFSGYAAQQQQEWIQPPLLQQQQPMYHQTDLSSLSTSLNNITLSSTTIPTNESSSAGLNKKQGNNTWEQYTL